MGLTADIILNPAALTRMYAEGMLKEVKPEQFSARLATSNGKPVQSNHPAFVFGHIALYLPKVPALLGQPAIANPPRFDELFANGKPCLDDAVGTIYPSMDAILAHFRAGWDAAVSAIGGADDADFGKPNPAEGRWKQMFPTVGGVINFYLSGHAMSHLGQVSAWRRLMGLGSAM